MSAKKPGQKTEAVSAFQRLERMHPHKTFLFFAIVGSAMAFLSLIFLYAIRIADVRITADFRFPKIFMVSTVLLLVSSYSLSRCARAFRNDEMMDLRISLFATLLLAVAFCTTQILGCKELYDAGVFVNGQPGVAFLYLITGLHFIHVTGGIFALSYLNFNTYMSSNDMVKQLLYFSSKREKNKIELVSIFWHFVDFVWLFLFFMFLFFIVIMHKCGSNFFASIFTVFFSFTVLCACKKEKIDIQYYSIPTNTADNLFKIKKADANTFYLCGGVTGSGFIMKSIDAGETWTVLQNNFPGKVLDMDFTASQKMIAVSEKITFYLTGDEWQSWQLIMPPTGEYPLTGYDSDMFSIDMVNDSTGFSCGGKQYQHGVIYRTNDGGITWRYTYKEHEMKNVLMIDAVTGYASGYGVIYKTDDGGLNWNVTDASNDYFTCMAKAESNHVFAGGYEGSIVDVYNGSDNWSKKNKSNQPFGKRIHFNCIDFYDNKTGAAAGTNGVIYITRNGGESWEAGSAFDGTQINSIVLTSDNSGLAGGAKGKLYKFQF